jgi:hypothetical protein
VHFENFRTLVLKPLARLTVADSPSYLILFIRDGARFGVVDDRNYFFIISVLSRPTRRLNKYKGKMTQDSRKPTAEYMSPPSSYQSAFLNDRLKRAQVFLRGTQVRRVQVPRKSRFCVQVHLISAYVNALNARLYFPSLIMLLTGRQGLH